MPITFPSYDAFLYVEVLTVVEYREGTIYKTRPKGYARSSRPKQTDEIYVSLSTRLLRQETITLEVLDA